MSYLAKDLTQEQKVAIESLLGRPIAETEAISILAYEPAPTPLSAERQAALNGLRQHFAAIDARVQPPSEDEADSLFEEAMRSSRPEFRIRR